MPFTQADVVEAAARAVVSFGGPHCYLRPDNVELIDPNTGVFSYVRNSENRNQSGVLWRVVGPKPFSLCICGQEPALRSDENGVLELTRDAVSGSELLTRLHDSLPNPQFYCGINLSRYNPGDMSTPLFSSPDTRLADLEFYYLNQLIASKPTIRYWYD